MVMEPKSTSKTVSGGLVVVGIEKHAALTVPSFPSLCIVIALNDTTHIGFTIT